MTCQDARDLFSARADDALNPAEQAQLHAHLATCTECQREWARFERTVALLRAVEPAHAPAGFVDRVVAARPRPWYTRLARGLFVPWPVKLPLEAAAVVLVAGLAIMIVQRSPELQQASRLPEVPTAVTTAPPASTVAPASEPAAVATVAPAERQKEPKLDAGAPAKIGAPPPDSRADSTAALKSSPAREPMRDAAESPRDATGNLIDERAKSREAPRALLRKEAAPRGELLSGQTAAVAPPPAAPSTTAPSPVAPPLAAPSVAPSVAAPPVAAPSASAEAQSTEKRASVERLSAAQGVIPAAAGLQARLTVGDRAAAELRVRELVTQAAGRIVSQAVDGDATVLIVLVPADRWDELRRGLEAVGTLRLTGQKVEGAGRLSVTLRLER
jgi:anti-sigma factor RsiW